MLDRFIDRLPALLLLGVILIAAQVAIVQAGRPGQLIGAIPAAVLLVLYVRAGSGGAGRRGAGGGGKAGTSGRSGRGGKDG